MNAPNLQMLRQEPLISGIITGFSTLFAIALVNLIGNLLFKDSGITGAILLSLAIIAAFLAGAVAAFRSKKLMDRRQVELKIANSLASGDFSNSVWSSENERTDLSKALADIADRQLAIERSNGQLIQEAAARESQLISALDCVNQEIVVFDRSGLLVCANSAYLSKCNMIGAVVALGMTRKEVWAELAKAPRANLPLNERQSWFKIQEEMRHEAASTKAPVGFVHLNGESAQMSVHATKDGHQVEIIENTGKWLEMEERAQKAEREANAMGRLKQVTLSRLSHTIRTPMTGVLAAAELLSDTVLDDKQRARLDIIRRSAGTLLGVVQDMFDMAQTTSADDGIAPQKNAEARKQALICSTPADLAQAASEILGKDNFEVTIFEPFAQQTGAIEAWNLATEKHASVIVLADNNQKDSILAITGSANLSFRPDLKLFSELITQTKHPEAINELLAPPAEPNTKHPIAARHLDLLIAESSEVNQIYLSNSLEKSGFAFKIVGTGAQAIEIAKAEKPRLILTDISIPDIDGLQVTAAIRAGIQNDATAPMIIGMTNHFMQGDSVKCLNAGMDHYMAKPQTAEDLLNLLHEWLKSEPLKKAS